MFSSKYQLQMNLKEYKYNIGITAGVETTMTPQEFIQWW